MGKSEAKVRKRCFFDISINEVSAGRIVFEIYDDIVPKTAENFRALCTGEVGIGKTTNKPLHYKDCSFHRVVRNFMIQGGDFSEHTGRGGESIFGGFFPDENFDRLHDRPYLLSMANRGKNTNGSQFFITTQPAPHLDNLHVVFGEVISGKEVIKKVEHQPTNEKSRPYNPCTISNCGELVLVKKTKILTADDLTSSSESSSDSSSSGSDVEEIRKFKKRQKKLKKKEKKRKKKVKREKKDGEVDRGNGIYCTVKDPSDVPADPPNYFLARRMPSPDTLREREKERKEKKEKESKDRDESEAQRRKERNDDSGRRIKGRGSSRIDRAGTPPHWREGNSERISMKDYRDREQQRAAEERWTKSIRQPEKDDIDPRVYGRYDDKAESRKKREDTYREKKQLIKRFNRRQEKDDYYNHVKGERSDREGYHSGRSRSRSPNETSPPRESKFERKRRSASMSE